VKKAVLVLAVALLAVAMLATPVLAIGPYNAYEVGNNPNLKYLNGGTVNAKGNAGGSNVWAWSTTSGFWVRWKWLQPTDDKGIMNKAVMVTSMEDLELVVTADYENKWIYLSGDDEPGYPNLYQFAFPPPSVPPTDPGFPMQFYLWKQGSHGMLWWLFFAAFKSVGAADSAATSFPYGALWMHNNIQD